MAIALSLNDYLSIMHASHEGFSLVGALDACKTPYAVGPAAPTPYPNVSTTTARTASSAEPGGQKGMVTRECWVAALQGALARVYRAPLFDLDVHTRSLWITLEEIRRHRAELDVMQLENRDFVSISNARNARAQMSMNSITNVR